MGSADRADVMRRVRAFKASHPQVFIREPGETLSGSYWEVSFPSSATIAFDNPATMLQALSMISIPDDDTAP